MVFTNAYPVNRRDVDRILAFTNQRTQFKVFTFLYPDAHFSKISDPQPYEPYKIRDEDPVLAKVRIRGSALKTKRDLYSLLNEYFI